MRKVSEFYVYGYTGFDNTPKFYKVNKRDYKLISGKGYGAFHEYDDTTVIKNRKDCMYESIILHGKFAKAKSWQELELLSTLFYNATI